MESPIYEIPVKTIKGENTNLSHFKNKVLLIANTASKCGFTPQYKGLQDLYQTYKDQGLVVLGFPCNQFGGQEPDGESSIQEFCQVNYGVTFPMFSKIEVNGKNAHPLFEYLKEGLPGVLGTKLIKWNFTKFLVDKNGMPYKRFSPQSTPEELKDDIEELLKS